MSPLSFTPLPSWAHTIDLEPLRWLTRRIGRPLVSLDTETTMFVDADTFGIAEAALVTIAPTGDIRCASTLIDPRLPMHPGATSVSGLTDEILRGQPTFDAIHADLALHLSRSNAILTGYCVDSFDLRGIARECGRYHLPVIEATEVRDVKPAFAYYEHEHDTAGLENKRLTSIAAYLGIVLNGDAHRALYDALLAVGIMAEFVARCGTDAFLGGYVLPQRTAGERSKVTSRTASTLTLDRERLRCAAEAAVASLPPGVLSHDEIAAALTAAGFLLNRHEPNDAGIYGVTVIDANGLRARIEGSRYEALRRLPRFN